MRNRVQTLTFEESEKLLQQLIRFSASRWRKDLRCRNHCMALLMLDAGLRVGEVCRLMISDLFWKNEAVKSIIISAGISKNKTERQIPISDKLCEAINWLAKNYWLDPYNNFTDFAFKTQREKIHMTPRQVERIILEAGSRAIGKRVTPHVLRHTFATRLARKVNIRVVQELLGHKSITSTQIYTHPDSDDLKEAINYFNGDPK